MKIKILFVIITIESWTECGCDITHSMLSNQDVQLNMEATSVSVCSCMNRWDSDWVKSVPDLLHIKWPESELVSLLFHVSALYTADKTGIWATCSLNISSGDHECLYMLAVSEILESGSLDDNVLCHLTRQWCSGTRGKKEVLLTAHSIFCSRDERLNWQYQCKFCCELQKTLVRICCFVAVAENK